MDRPLVALIHAESHDPLRFDCSLRGPLGHVSKIPGDVVVAREDE